ncbi:MAG: HEAT repeat domain-containing protein, partial [Planctomycetota bacterium]|nr:HEAT repeat domain-containing protein [Planctomycetota bacterium]
MYNHFKSFLSERNGMDEEKKMPPTVSERMEELKGVVKKRRFRIIFTSSTIGVALSVFLFVLMPTLEVRRQVENFHSNELGRRMEALRWLVEKLDARKAIDFCLEALVSPYTDENTQSYEILSQRLSKHFDSHVINRLVAIWRNKQYPPLSREHSLFLLAEFGDKSLESLFLEPEVWLVGRAWDAGWRYMKRFADEKTVERLLGMLGSGDMIERRAAAFAIRTVKHKPFVKENRKVVESLLPLLKEPVVELREEAMETLWELVDLRDEGAVVAAITDSQLPSAYVRKFGARALGRMKSKNQADLLISLLSDADGGVVEAAAIALKELGEPSILRRVAEKAVAPESDTIVRVACINILSGFDTEEARSALVQMLYIDDPQIAHRLVQVLWRVADEGVVKGVVLAMKRAPSPQMRAMCALLLGWLRRVDFVDELVQCAVSDAPNVALSVGNALCYILDEKALASAIRIFDEKGSSSEVKVAMVQTLAFYRTGEALKRLAEGIGSSNSRLQEECFFALTRVVMD